MRKSLLSVLVLSAAVLFGHQPAFAQDASTQSASSQNDQIDQDILLLRKDIRSQKKQLIAANLPLTDTEAQNFWPIYDQFTQELVMVNNDKYALIKEYAQGYSTMTDAQADNWTQRLLKLDANVAALRQKYWANFRKVLPAKKTALYEQIERRAQMIIDLQIASQVPLVQP
jgi:septal ring factor EnvC (AmiA/AmiB activator)